VPVAAFPSIQVCVCVLHEKLQLFPVAWWKLFAVWLTGKKEKWVKRTIVVDAACVAAAAAVTCCMPPLN